MSVDPVAFKIGSLTIHWYGIFMAAGMGLAMWTASLRGARDHLKADDISNLFFWIIIGGLAGAKLLYVVDTWDPQAQSLGSVLFSRSGLVFQGALIGAVTAVVVFVRKYKMPMWKTLDALGPSIALGYFLGRLGCFMSGCCHGSACGFEHFHSVSGGVFSHGEVVTGHGFPWIALVFKEGGLGSLPNQPLYPTQLMEATGGLLMYLGLAWLHKHRRFPGQVFVTYAIAYSTLRFAIEFLRGDDLPRFLNDRVTQGQIISVLLVGGGIWCWIWLARQAPKDEPAPTP